jgi:pyruvate dehydrogenase E1 component beta subunit
MPELVERAVERELTFAQAVREALAEEMRRDPTVCIIGEDVAEAGTPFKVLSGLVEEFGKERVIDTPISEAGFTGVGVGAAMTGMRPVVDIMFGDFLTLTMDQMVNQAAKVHYMSGGKWKVPMVLRTTLGATRRSAAQHSQSLHAWFSHVPGLKVVLPSTPYDAKGLLKTAIRDDNPVIFFEDKMMYKTKGPVPEGDTPFLSVLRISSAKARTLLLWAPAAWCKWRLAQRPCWMKSASALK